MITTENETVIELDHSPKGCSWSSTVAYDDDKEKVEVNIGRRYGGGDESPVAEIILGEFNLKLVGSTEFRDAIKKILRPSKNLYISPTPQLSNALRKLALSEVGKFVGRHPMVLGKIMARNYQRGIVNGERRWRRKFKAFLEGEDS